MRKPSANILKGRLLDDLPERVMKFPHQHEIHEVRFDPVQVAKRME